MLRRCYGSKVPEVQHKRVRFVLSGKDREKHKSDFYQLDSIIEENFIAWKLSSPPNNHDDKFFSHADLETAIEGDNDATREESA